MSHVFDQEPHDTVFASIHGEKFSECFPYLDYILSDAAKAMACFFFFKYIYIYIFFFIYFY